MTALLLSILLPAAFGILAGYLAFKKAPPAWFVDLMARRFSRMFGVPDQPRDGKPTVRICVNDRATPELQKVGEAIRRVMPELQEADEAMRRVTAALPKTSEAMHGCATAAQAARLAMHEFGRVGAAGDAPAPLPVGRFLASEHAVMTMLPRQMTAVLRRSAGSVVHKLSDAPPPIRFLAGMLTEGTEYRLSKREGAIYLTAMGEATPISALAQEARTAPQIEEETLPPPDMGDDDLCYCQEDVTCPKCEREDCPERQPGPGHKLVMMADDQFCELCGQRGDALLEPCAPVNE